MAVDQNRIETAGTSVDAFRAKFWYVVEYEPPSLALDINRGFILDRRLEPVEG